MTTTERADVLAADDVAALRAADSVTFHLTYDDEAHACIRAWLKPDVTSESRIYTAREQRLFPSVGGILDDTRVREIDTGYAFINYGRGNISSAFACVLSAKSDDTWPTIARELRTGDRVTLYWKADNNNGTLTEAGLHMDVLHIRLHTPPKPPRELHVATSITPNNSARMIQF